MKILLWLGVIASLILGYTLVIQDFNTNLYVIYGFVGLIFGSFATAGILHCTENNETDSIRFIIYPVFMGIIVTITVTLFYLEHIHAVGFLIFTLGVTIPGMIGIPILIKELRRGTFFE